MTSLGIFRLLIADTDVTNQVLTDDQVTGFLAMHGVSFAYTETAPMWLVRRAAAEALDAIATSETLVGKVISSQDLSTDGPKVAASLRVQADRLRVLAASEQVEADDDGGLSVLEFSPWAGA